MNVWETVIATSFRILLDDVCDGCPGKLAFDTRKAIAKCVANCSGFAIILKTKWFTKS